jgi:hypothetical protein
MSLSNNPFSGWASAALTGGSSVSLQSFLRFRIIHPAAESDPSTVAPLDILNCTVLDPHSRKHLVVSTMLPKPEGRFIPVPMTYIQAQNAQRTVVGSVEWQSPYPNVASSVLPRQALPAFMQTLPSSTVSFALQGRPYAWLKNDDAAGDLVCYDTASNPQKVMAVLSKEHSGGMLLSVSPDVFQGGLLDSLVLTIVLILSGKAA